MLFVFSMLFALSGFAALVYETLWFRYLGLIFGNTVHAAATVMTAFMAGLAIGNHLAAKLGVHIRKPLRTFGLLEVSIALYALALPFLLSFVRVAYRTFYQDISTSHFALTLLRFLLAGGMLLIPAALMGMTLPVLCRGLLHRKETFSARLGILYGMNTFGAVAGVLACGFLLLPRFGLVATNWIGAATSFAVGLTAIVLARSTTVSPQEEDVSEAPVVNAATAGKRGELRVLLSASALAGFLALALEVAWFRALVLVFGSTTYSFAAMLAVFLLGIGLGAIALSWLGDRLKTPVLAFAAAQATIGVYTLVSLYWFDAMPYLLLQFLASHGLTWGNLLTCKFAVTLVFLFVPTLMSGVSLTLLARQVRGFWPSADRTVGEVFACNTLGAAAGACAGGFVLLPLLGIHGTLMALGCGSLFLGSLASARFYRARSWIRAWPVFLTIGVGVMLAIFPQRWDRKLLAAGAYFSPWGFISDGKVQIASTLASRRLLYYHEGVTATASTALSFEETLSFSMDGKVEADGLPRGQVIQRMIGHAPMLFHPSPKKVLNIGMGAGVTLGALGCYPVEQLHVVEIEPAVTNVARIWAPLNHNILKHPKLEIIVGDGRNYLFCTTNLYDVITSDPFEPVVGGAANLFTVEHFQQARTRLNKGGVMCQWVPMYEMSERDFETIIRSFASVFPQGALFFAGADIVIVGFSDELRLDPNIVRAKFEIPEVRDSLAEIGVESPELVLGMFIGTLESLTSQMSPAPLNTDQFPVIEFSVPKSAVEYTADANQQVLLDCFTEIPAHFLEGIPAAGRDSMIRAHEALREVLKASILRANGQDEASLRLLIAAAESSPDNPVVCNELVSIVLAVGNTARLSGDLKGAFFQYQVALHYDPKSFWALHHLVGLAMQGGKPELARKWLERGLELYPSSPAFIALRGRYRGTMKDIPGAIEDLATAIKALPDMRDLWEDYAFFLDAAGRSAAALEARKTMEKLPK